MPISHNLQQHITWLLRSKANVPPRREKGRTPRGTPITQSSEKEEAEEGLIESSRQQAVNIPQVPRVLQRTTSNIINVQSKKEEQSTQSQLALRDIPSFRSKDSFETDSMPTTLKLGKETPRRMLTSVRNLGGDGLNDINGFGADDKDDEKENQDKGEQDHPGMSLMQSYTKQVHKGGNTEFRTPQPKPTSRALAKATAMTSISKNRQPIPPMANVEAIDLTLDDDLDEIDTSPSKAKTFLSTRAAHDPITAPSEKPPLQPDLPRRPITLPGRAESDDAPPPYSSLPPENTASNSILDRDTSTNATLPKPAPLTRTRSVPYAGVDFEEEIEETETITKKTKRTRTLRKGSEEKVSRATSHEPTASRGAGQIAPKEDLRSILSKTFGSISAASQAKDAASMLQKIIPDSDEEDALDDDDLGQEVDIHVPSTISTYNGTTASATDQTTLMPVRHGYIFSRPAPMDKNVALQDTAFPSNVTVQRGRAASQTPKRLTSPIKSVALPSPEKLPKPFSESSSRDVSVQVPQTSSDSKYGNRSLGELKLLQQKSHDEKTRIKSSIKHLLDLPDEDIGEPILQMAKTMIELEANLKRIKTASDILLSNMTKLSTTIGDRAMDKNHIHVHNTQSLVEESPRKQITSGDHLERNLKGPTMVEQTQFPVLTSGRHQEARLPDNIDSARVSPMPDIHDEPFTMHISSPPEPPNILSAKRTLEALSARQNTGYVQSEPFATWDEGPPEIEEEEEQEDDLHDFNAYFPNKNWEKPIAHEEERDKYDDEEEKIEEEEYYGSHGGLDELDEDVPVVTTPRRQRAMSQAESDDSDDFQIIEQPAIFSQARSMGPPRCTQAAPISQVPHGIDMSSPSMSFKWSKEVAAAMQQVYKKEGFRDNQVEAINAALAGEDVFVLMPTGGGKSLCYQVPAIIKSGNTRGLTVVVSPLLSLMQDQVDNLHAYNVQASLFCGTMPEEAKRIVADALRRPDFEQYIQLLYVTPEMLQKSTKLGDILKELHQKHRLARIVIDEAHCVSHWGHDFRPDYTMLGDFRTRLPGVPFMALTATANNLVQYDIKANLGMQTCKVFKQSFNRPNLIYKVAQKTKRILDDIVNIITSPQYRGKPGIVYCLARDTCEKVAGALKMTYNINAQFYHAGLDNKDRVQVQKDWQQGKCNVIVATIAFGMGIDKPDVRYVIHHSLPKTLEGLYQETGRAGRDGNNAGCYLFYSYGDTKSLQSMIDRGDGNYDIKKRQKESLQKVVAYCENKQDCRRQQVLEYFNEIFDPRECRKTCDNCAAGIKFRNRDVSAETRNIIKLVLGFRGSENYTLPHLTSVFRGSKIAKIREAGHDRLEGFGSGKEWLQTEADRLMHQLVSRDILTEYHVANKMGFSSSYVRAGPNHQSYLRGKKIEMPFEQTPTAKNRSRNATAGSNTEDLFHSTNVSSPVQETVKRRTKMTAFNSRSLDTNSQGGPDSLGFNPIRESNRSSKKRKSDGATQQQEKRRKPITISQDPVLSKLNPYEQDMLERFMQEAKAIRGNITNDLGLRVESVFTDTELRHMGVELPCKKQEMLSLPNISSDRLNRYWGKFLPLCQKYSNEREDNMAGAAPAVMDDMNVADLEQYFTSDEDSFQYLGDNDDDDNDDDDDGNVDGDSSRYFLNAPSQAVQDFNSQLAAASTTSTKSRTTKETQTTGTTRRRAGASQTGYAGKPRRSFSKRGGKAAKGRGTGGNTQNSARTSTGGGAGRSQTATGGRSRATTARGGATGGGGGDGGGSGQSRVRSMLDMH